MATVVLGGSAIGAAVAVWQGGVIAFGALIGAVVVPGIVLMVVKTWIESGPIWFVIIGIFLILVALRGC